MAEIRRIETERLIIESTFIVDKSITVPLLNNGTVIFFLINFTDCVSVYADFCVIP